MRKYWHSAFDEGQLFAMLSLVNRVYKEDILNEGERRAAEDLITVVAVTGRETFIHANRSKETMTRAISDAVNDPMWRRLLKR